MNTILYRVYTLSKNNTILGISIIFACWIKFNIVLFTYNTYTGTKIFFPFFFLILLGITLGKLNRTILVNPQLWILIFFSISFLSSVGYLNNPYDWGIYRQKSLSLISYLSIYYGVLYLTKSQKKKLFFSVYIFSIISLIYVILQVYFDVSYTSGHMRTAFSGNKPYGILDNPNHSSGVLLIGFFFGISLAFYSRKFLIIFPLLFGFLLGMRKFNSFGALFGLAGGLAVMIAGLFPSFSLGKKVKGTFFLFFATWLAIFFSMIAFYWIYTVNFMEIQTLLSTEISSISQRLKLIEWATAIFLDNWCFGIGFANDFNPEIHALFNSQSFGVVRSLHIHTTILSAFATTGIFGGSALVLLIACTIFRFSYLFANQIDKKGKVFIFSMFSMFIAIQILSYSAQMLFSICYWFSLILPFLLDFTLPEDERTEEKSSIR